MKSATKYTDIELFQIFKSGQNEAFEELYTRHWTGLMKEAQRLIGSKAAAKDIVQDTFVSLFQKAAFIEIKYSLKAYLFQTLRFKIINRRRNNHIHDSCHYEIYRRAKCDIHIASELETKELSINLHSAIAGLPKKCRQVFLLSREGDFSHKNISRQLNISTSTVEKHIGKALKILREKLHHHEYLC